MRLLNNLKIIISLFFLSFSIQVFANEAILDYHISKVKQSYENLNNQAEVCFRQEANNSITNFNYNDPRIKDINIFKFVDYIYIQNQDVCLYASLSNLSHKMLILRSLFNEYDEKGNLYLDSVLDTIAINILTETKFKIEKKYADLPKQAKEYLEKTLGKKPFNIKPFREIYTKKLEKERELRLKK